MGNGSEPGTLTEPAFGAPSSRVVGLAGALLTAFAASWHLSPVQIAASGVLGGIMAAIAAEDLRRFRVPDLLNLAAALAGLLAVWASVPSFLTLDAATELGGAALSALLCGGALFLMREAFFRFRGVDGLGLGDVKLAAAGGIWLGGELFATAIMLAAFGALAFVAARTVVEGPWPRTRRIPFALYLAPAIWICWFGSLVLPAV
jgi:leader peptidase (prepilin peptidase)/N-methyltransferase